MYSFVHRVGIGWVDVPATSHNASTQKKPAAVGFGHQLREKSEVLGGIAPGRLQQDQDHPWRCWLGLMGLGDSKISNARIWKKKHGQHVLKSCSEIMLYLRSTKCVSCTKGWVLVAELQNAVCGCECRQWGTHKQPKMVLTWSSICIVWLKIKGYTTILWTDIHRC